MAEDRFNPGGRFNLRKGSRFAPRVALGGGGILGVPNRLSLGQNINAQQSATSPPKVQDVRPSLENVQSAEDRFSSAFKASQGGGFGGLGGGIAALVLGKKSRDLRNQRNKTEVMQEDLALDKKAMENERAQQVIDLGKSEIEQQRTSDAQQRITLGRSKDIINDAQMAGAELVEAPNGLRPKTYREKFNEMQQSGNLNIGGSVDALVKHNPALATVLDSPFLKGFDKSVSEMMRVAAQEKRLHENSLNRLQEAKVKAKGDPNKIARDDLKAASSTLSSLSKMLQDMSQMSGQSKKEKFFQETIAPTVSLFSEFIQGTKYRKTFPVGTPREVADAMVDMFGGDPSSMSELLTQYNDLKGKIDIDLQKPETSPEKVKTKNKPVPVSGSQGVNEFDALLDDVE